MINRVTPSVRSLDFRLNKVFRTKCRTQSSYFFYNFTFLRKSARHGVVVKYYHTICSTRLFFFFKDLFLWKFFFRMSTRCSPKTFKTYYLSIVLSCARLPAVIQVKPFRYLFISNTNTDPKKNVFKSIVFKNIIFHKTKGRAKNNSIFSFFFFQLRLYYYYSEMDLGFFFNSPRDAKNVFSPRFELLSIFIHSKNI